MWDKAKKQKEMRGMALACFAALAAVFIISCGYGADNVASVNEAENINTGNEAENINTGNEAENINTGNEAGNINTGNGAENINTGNEAGNINTGNETENITTAITGQPASFSYNNVHNGMVRCYGDEIYIALENGIYRLKNETGEGELIYPNLYWRRGGMETDNGFLYFCGSAQRGEEETATVYRMNLETMETEDALAVFSQRFDVLYDISIYEGKLYVSDGNNQKIGFQLSENGEIAKQLDETAADFLYKENNDYMALELAKRNAAVEEEYRRLAEEQEGRYSAVADVASCKKMLQGRHVVSRYKDELLRSIYLESENGTRQYLCDATGFPILVTETGLYYAPDEGREIWYVDFAAGTRERFYAGNAEGCLEAVLINYDADYVYLLQKRDMGYDMVQNRIEQIFLLRVPREGGSPQQVYRSIDTYAANGWYGHCGVYPGGMYLENLGMISLGP